MWLSKEERIILRIVFKNVDRPEENFYFDDLIIILPITKKNDSSYIRKKIIPALEKLRYKRLIEYNLRPMEYEIALTQDGYDLAKKYSHYFDRTTLWCKEYHHNIILSAIVSIIVTIVTIIIIEWLIK